MSYTLTQTLGLEPNMSTYFAHAPAEYFDEIGAQYRTRHPDEDGMYEFIHAFFTDKEQLEASAPLLISKLADQGKLWISTKESIVSSQLTKIFTPLGLSEKDSTDHIAGWRTVLFGWF